MAIEEPGMITSVEMAVSPVITRSDYIQVPGYSGIISKFEVQGDNNLNWQETHFKLHDNGLYMPTTPFFMTHFTNVVDVYNSKGKKQLLDGNGSPVSEKEAEDIALHMLKAHKAVYGNLKGAWTWLDAYFENGEVKSEHRSVMQGSKRILQPQKIEDLESCLTENCFANLDFNRQGLPTISSQEQKYVLGRNIYFRIPMSGGVVGFIASSDRLGFYCDWVPSGGDSYLGVYAVADVGSNASQNFSAASNVKAPQTEERPEWKNPDGYNKLEMV